MYEMLYPTENDDSTEPLETVSEPEQPYDRLREAVSDYVCSVYVQDGRAVETRHGENCTAITGYTPDEFAADPMLWIRLVVREDRPLVTRQVEEILSGGGAPSIEHRLRRKDGAIRWVRNTPIPFTDPKRNLIRYDAVIQDVTHRKSSGENEYYQSPDLRRLETMVREDLLQLLTAARFRVELMMVNPTAATEFAEVLGDLNEILTQCGRKARTISRKLGIHAAPEFEAGKEHSHETLRYYER